MIGLIKGTMRTKKALAGLPSPIASFKTNGNAPLLEVKPTIAPVQSGSGDPSPSNPRPISGWDSVKVSATGKNLFDGKFYAGGSYNANVGKDYSGITEEAVTTISDGNYSISVSSWGGMGFITPPFNGKVTQTVHISGSTTAPSPRMSLYTLDKDKVVLRKTTYGTNRTTFDYNITLAEGEVYVFLWVATADTGTVTVSNIQCEFGNETTPYELPNGQTATIPLPHTVYGGELDIVSGSGSEDRAIITFDGSNDENWSLGQTGTGWKRFQISQSDKKNWGTTTTFHLISDRFASTNQYDIWTIREYAKNIWLYVDSDVISDVSDLRTWLSNNPTQVCYYLATPTTITTSPVALNARNGTNNVWSDTGDISELKFIEHHQYIGR